MAIELNRIVREIRKHGYWHEVQSWLTVKSLRIVQALAEWMNSADLLMFFSQWEMWRGGK